MEFQTIDENNGASFFEHIFKNRDCGSLSFTNMKIGKIEIPALLDPRSVFNMIRNDVCLWGRWLKSAKALTRLDRVREERSAPPIWKFGSPTDSREMMSLPSLTSTLFKRWLGTRCFEKRADCVWRNYRWRKNGLRQISNLLKNIGEKELCPTVPCRKVQHKLEMGNLVQPLSGATATFKWIKDWCWSGYQKKSLLS